jgi:uncharacterized iron-regulated membrane protein
VHIFRDRNLVQVFQMTDRTTVLVNPYDGTVQGTKTGASGTQRWLGYIHQLHTHLIPDPRSAQSAAEIGEVIVQIVGLLLCLLVPTGLILWWRTKRASIRMGPWPRVVFDAHHAIGIWAGAFLFVAAVTGVLVGQGSLFFAITHSKRPSPVPKMESVAEGSGVAIEIDRAMEIARETIGGASITDVSLPRNSKGIYSVLLRVPEETSEAVRSHVMIDQYSGKVLHKVDFRTEPAGYRAVRFNRSIHTGDVFGTTGHLIVAASSLLLVVMVVSGLVIWLRKLA